MIKPINIGQKLKEIRKSRGLTLVALSKKMGLKGTKQLSQYEEGYSEPNLKTWIKLCRVLEISLSQCLEIDNNAFEPLGIRFVPEDDFAIRLKALRIYRAWTKAELEQLSEIAVNYLSTYEGGRSLPNFKNFLVLCNTLRVMPHILLNVDNLGCRLNEKSER